MFLCDAPCPPAARKHAALEYARFFAIDPRGATGPSRERARARSIYVSARSLRAFRFAANAAPGMVVGEEGTPISDAVFAVAVRAPRNRKTDLLSSGHRGRLVLRIGNAGAGRAGRG